jgi:hypothetical protein
MGIQGLLKNLSEAREVRRLSEFRGTVMAIDGYVWLHRAMKSRHVMMRVVKGYCDHANSQLDTSSTKTPPPRYADAITIDNTHHCSASYRLYMYALRSNTPYTRYHTSSCL